VTYVIGEPCIDIKDRSCVDVCPVDCIHATDDDPMFFIDPDECIDCGACEPECPVNAIYPEDALPAEWAKYTEVDARWFKDKPSARTTIDEWKPPA
jgi:ferredoxin